MLKEDVHYILTREQKTGYQTAKINEEFLKENIPDFMRQFYICGPDAMVLELQSILAKLGASPETIVFEK